MYDITCTVCGNVRSANNREAKYCGKVCEQVVRYGKGDNRKLEKCPECKRKKLFVSGDLRVCTNDDCRFITGWGERKEYEHESI